ncbi:CBS domain-containing protein [Pseudomonas zhanjiangensis]|uniref:CBS domain-containing protein n=1 Tax=Pseudomonas zhanjiangensis TaxID=3239015 RepID=A0ABV3YWG2_9PSED
MQTPLLDWCRSLAPAPLQASPQEWLRAAGGVALVLLLTLATGAWLFDAPLTLRLAGPAAASAVLLFAASSSPFAQPWPILGGNLIAALISIGLGQAGLHGLPAALLAVCLVFAVLLLLRCPHPPACALAVVIAGGGPRMAELGYALLYPVLLNGLLLLLVALLYGQLTGHAYPRSRQPRDNPHHTRDPLPSERLSFTDEDVDQALREFGEYVDVTRDDLQRLIKQTEKHALRRSMGDVRAAQIMSRDLCRGTPDTPIEHALATLRQHRLRALPVVDDGGRLLGIVTLVDLLRYLRPGPADGQGARLRDIMSTPVQAVRAEAHMVELVYLLSDRGLHCLPVVDGEQRLLGMLTQTDLIAALYNHWLKQLAD